MLSVMEETQNKEAARLVWELKMEELRHWLGLLFGIKITYV
jgi:hypothetical protein